MRPKTLALALALAFCSLPMAALAQDSGDASGNAQDAPAATNAEAPAAEEEGGPVTWSLAVTSDYVFRGITQTDYDPALQAGLTFLNVQSFYQQVAIGVVIILALLFNRLQRGHA